MKYLINKISIYSTLSVIGFISIIYLLMSFFLASQVTVSERNPLEENPVDYLLEYEDVSFSPRSDDTGISLKGWFIPAEVTTDTTIIIVHGLNSNRAAGFMLPISQKLHQNGFNTLLIDLRGHGESGGDRFNGGYIERLDVLGAVDFLKSRGIASSNVGLLGFSLGAGVVLMAAENESDINAVVADSGFASVDDLIVQEVRRRTNLHEDIVPILIPGFTRMTKLFYGIDVDLIRPIRSAGKLEYPIFFIHGGKDERIPVDHSKRMAEASFNQDTKLWIVEFVEHAGIYDDNPDYYISELVNYFSNQIAN